jgi:hypothetical protein
MIADFLAAYLILSREGRAFLRRQRPKRAPDRAPRDLSLIRDRESRRSLLRTLRLCDRIFHEVVAPALYETTGRTRAEVYSRLVPFAWIGVEIRARFMDAYGASPGAKDNRLLALLILVHREWDDRLEEYPPETLMAAVLADQPPFPKAALANRLTHLFIELAAEMGCLAKYQAMLDRLQAFYHLPFTPSEAAEYLEKKAAMDAEAHFALLSRIPPEMEGALRPFGLWLFGLDEGADIGSDRARGRETYMTLAADPVAEIERFHLALVEHVRRTATRDPRRLFLLMRSMTDDVVEAIRSGRSIEREFYGGTDSAAVLNPDKSKPYLTE